MAADHLSRLEAESKRSSGAIALMQGKSQQIGHFIQAASDTVELAKAVAGGGG